MIKRLAHHNADRMGSFPKARDVFANRSIHFDERDTLLHMAWVFDRDLIGCPTPFATSGEAVPIGRDAGVNF